MSLNPNPSRRAVFALGTAAFLGASLLGSFSAAAQQVNVSTKGSAACAKYVRDPASHAQCEYNESTRRTNAAVDVTACTNFLLSGVKDGRFTLEKIQSDAGGKVTQDNACSVARNYGFGRKAEVKGLAAN